MMKRVYVCAELGEKGNLEQMKEYSRYVLMRGAAPVVPHFYLLCLDDSDPKEREIKSGKRLALLPAPPLRTVRDSFPSYGSSLS